MFTVTLEGGGGGSKVGDQCQLFGNNKDMQLKALSLAVRRMRTHCRRLGEQELGRPPMHISRNTPSSADPDDIDWSPTYSHLQQWVKKKTEMCDKT